MWLVSEPPERGDAGRRGDHAVALGQLLRALDGLPARQREVFVSRYLEDLNTAETAAALGMRPGTVKAHLHRAMATLATLLGTNPE